MMIIIMQVKMAPDPARAGSQPEAPASFREFRGVVFKDAGFEHIS